MEIDPENIWHVYPGCDLEEHDTTCKVLLFGGAPKCLCKCDPKYELTDNSGLIIKHNSFDGREGLEWVNEILKQ